jgi:hypothetical protein
VSLKPVEINTLGGLDLFSDPQDVGAERAVDLLNVRFMPGRVRTRGGYQSFATGTAWTLLAPGPHAHDGSTTTAFDADDGTVLDTHPDAFVHSARMGTPTTSRRYFMGTGASASFQFTGAAYAAWTPTVDGVAAQPAPIGFVAGVTPTDNRLVVGNTLATGAFGASNHRLYFSEAGDADTWLTSRTLLLSPGDNQQIRAILTYRNQMIVFKDRKFFTFYGTATGSGGVPIFQNREINVGRGTSSVETACVTPHGIAFAAHDGVYLTGGDVPVKISQEIDPIWTGDFNDQSTYDGYDEVQSLRYHNGCLHLSVGNNVTARDFVYDMELKTWSVYSFSTGIGTSEIQSTSLFFISGTTIYEHVADDTYTTDAGTAIASHYQSGLYELGGMDAFTRWTRVYGSGSPTVGVLVDHATSDSRAAAVTLGTYPATTEGYHQQSYTGRYFAHRLSQASGIWSASKVIHDMAWQRS